MTPESSDSSASRPARAMSMWPLGVDRPPALRPAVTRLRLSASRSTMSSVAAPAVPRLTTLNSASSVLSVPTMPAADTLNSACGATRRAWATLSTPAASSTRSVAPQLAPLPERSVVVAALSFSVICSSESSKLAVRTTPEPVVTTSAWLFSCTGAVEVKLSSTRRSVPSPPTRLSTPASVVVIRSSPAPASTVSTVPLMRMTSLPPPPKMVFSPAPMSMRSAPSPPTKRSLPSPPQKNRPLRAPLTNSSLPAPPRIWLPAAPPSTMKPSLPAPPSKSSSALTRLST